MRSKTSRWVLACAFALAGCGGGDGPAEGTVSVRTSDMVALMAGQDGDGAWTTLAGSGGVYSLDVSGDRYGIAFACETAGTLSVNILLATVSDGREVEVDCATGPTGEPPEVVAPVTVGGTVSGLAAGQEGRVHIGGQTVMTTGTAGAFTADVPPGVRDVFVRRMTMPPFWDRIIRRNDVTLEEGATLDFDLDAEGFAPEMHTVVVDGLGAAETVSILALFLGSGGTPFPTGVFPEARYLAIPAAEMRGEDNHSIVVGVSGGPADTYRNVRRTFIGAEDFDASLPALPPAPTITNGAAGGGLRPEATLPGVPDADYVTMTYTQFETMPAMFQRAWAETATQSWIAAAGATSLALPDLSGLAGYGSRWSLVDGNELQWQQFHTEDSAGAAALLAPSTPATALAGRHERSTQRLGRITL